jgi:hypothetical protein
MHTNVPSVQQEEKLGLTTCGPGSIFAGVTRALFVLKYASAGLRLSLAAEKRLYFPN